MSRSWSSEEALAGQLASPRRPLAPSARQDWSFEQLGTFSLTRREQPQRSRHQTLRHTLASTADARSQYGQRPIPTRFDPDVEGLADCEGNDERPGALRLCLEHAEQAR